jgi:hypothetical protein
MVLIWENFYAIVLDGVVKILRRILGKMELIVLHLGKDLRVDFSLSHGRVEWSLGLRIFHTICRVGQKSNSTKYMIRIWIDICKVLNYHIYILQKKIN